MMNRDNYYLKSPTQELPSSQSRGVCSQSLAKRGKYRPNNEEVLEVASGSNGHQTQGDYYERNNQIRSELLQTSQYSSQQVDGAYYGVSEHTSNLHSYYHYDLWNSPQFWEESRKTSEFWMVPKSSGSLVNPEGDYYEGNNQIKSDLLQTSQYSSQQVDGAYGVSGDYYEGNNQIKSDLLQTSQYSSQQVDGAYGVSGDYYERNNQIKSDLLQTSQYSSQQVDGVNGVSVELRAKEEEKQNMNAYEDQWQIQSNIWNNNSSGLDVGTSNAMHVKQEYDQKPKRVWKNAFGVKDENTYTNPKKQKMLNPDASVYVPFTNSAVKEEPQDVSIGAVAISVATSTEVKPPWHSLYVDSIWKIICKNCYFVSEYWGLDDHTCSHNDDILSGTSHRQCDTCLMPLQDGETLKDHQKSRLHILFMINRQFDSQVEQLLEYYCYYCKIQSFSDKEHFQHNISETHLKNFQLLYPVINSFCVTCNLYFDSEGKDIHLASRVHLIQSIFNFNWYTSKKQKEMYSGCTFCVFCNEDCKANKNFLQHISSYQHSCNELQNKIKNTHIRNFQYISKIEKGFKCMLCNLLIPSEDLVPIHLCIETHIINIENFEDSKLFNLSKVVTVVKKAMPFDPCEDCRTKQRRCDHIYKDYMDYLTDRIKYVIMKFCFLCNAPKTETHELSDLHSKLSENLFYCQTCDKTYPLLKKDYHIKGYFHKKTVNEFGIRGNPNKWGIKQPKWTCKVCNFTLNNTENEIMYHLDSVRHNNSFKRFLTEDTTIECKLCRFVTRESDRYNDHIMSEGHLHIERTLKQEQSENYCYVCDNSVLNWKEHTDCPLHLLNLNKLKDVC